MPHRQTIYKSQDVVQVNIAAESGEMGVLAEHVPVIEQLKPGLVEIVEENGDTKQYFRTSRPSLHRTRPTVSRAAGNKYCWQRQITNDADI